MSARNRKNKVACHGIAMLGYLPALPLCRRRAFYPMSCMKYMKNASPIRRLFGRAPMRFEAALGTALTLGVAFGAPFASPLCAQAPATSTQSATQSLLDKAQALES